MRSVEEILRELLPGERERLRLVIERYLAQGAPFLDKRLLVDLVGAIGNL